MIDLQAFCSKDKTRPHLMRPWSRGEYTYASNGHIAVRTARRGDVADNDKAPDVERVLQKTEGIDFSVLSVKDFPNEKSHQCHVCEGRGTEHRCPSCKCNCEWCDGTGEETATVSIAMRGAIFDCKYIRMIVALPGAKFPNAAAKTNGSPFVFDGGVGVLMPMRAPCDHHIEEPE